MAKRDVREYCFIMLRQYLELKEDLADFEQAFKDGYITEDKLTEVKNDVNRLKENYDRLVYICYLLDLPNKPKKQEKLKRQNADIEKGFDKIGASTSAVVDENKGIIAHVKELLKDITNK